MKCPCVMSMTRCPEASPSIIGLMQCIKILPSHNVTRGFLGFFYLDVCPGLWQRTLVMFCTFVSLQYLVILQSVYFHVWKLLKLNIQHTLKRKPKRCGLITLKLQRKLLEHMMLPSFDMDCSLSPFGQVLRKLCMLNLGSPRSHSHAIVLLGRCHGTTPTKIAIYPSSHLQLRCS